MSPSMAVFVTRIASVILFVCGGFFMFSCYEGMPFYAVASVLVAIVCYLMLFTPIEVHEDGRN